MTEPKITDTENTFKRDFETLLNKSALPDALKQALQKKVDQAVAGKGEATAKQLQHAIDDGAKDYLDGMQGDLQQLRERGTFYKPLYQTPPNDGPNAALFQVMDSVRNVNQQLASLSEVGDVQRALLSFKPQVKDLLGRSGLKKAGGRE